MSSTYIISDILQGGSLPDGIDMDLEVKSELDSDEDNVNNDSTESTTSSVRKVSIENSYPCQSDDELEMEDEPLVEIESVTLPQELVEVKLEPSLLLFVNQDKKCNPSKKFQELKRVSEDVSTSFNKSAILKDQYSNKSIHEEDAKSVTKALRNVKRKKKLNKQNCTVLSIKNNALEKCKPGCIKLSDDNAETEPSSPCSLSYENQSERLYDTSSPNHTINNTRNLMQKQVKPKKKKVYKLNVKWKRCIRKNNNKERSIKEDLKCNQLSSKSSLNDDITFPSKSDEKGHIKTDYLEKENTEYNNKEMKLKENLIKNKTDHLHILINKKKSNKCKRVGQSKNVNEEKEPIHLLKPETFDCTICGKRFREKSHLATHSRAHIDIRNYKCNECGNLFKTKTNLYFHMKTHEEAPFICEKCNKIYSERKVLMRHIRVVHSGEGQYNCDQCGRSFKSGHNLDLHYTLHTGNKPFSCNDCGKTFVYKSTYITHMKAHEADDSFNCDLCPSNVVNKGEQRRRCYHHSEARPWLCTVCGKGYPLKGTLKNHMKTHEPEKPFKCNECGKTFMKKQSYECHMKIHAGENPQYMCDQCSQSYFNVFALKRHYMKHTSERRFICDICNKAFWMKDALKVHKRSHANEKLYQCTQCSKSFAHKHTLVAHVRTHSSDQQYPCTLCPKTFIHKYNLDRHERQHSAPPMPPAQTSLPLLPSLVMMHSPNHLDLPTLHIL